MQGETVALVAQLRRLGKALAFDANATATLYYQTNGMIWGCAKAIAAATGRAEGEVLEWGNGIGAAV